MPPAPLCPTCGTATWPGTNVCSVCGTTGTGSGPVRPPAPARWHSGGPPSPPAGAAPTAPPDLTATVRYVDPATPVRGPVLGPPADDRVVTTAVAGLGSLAAVLAVVVAVLAVARLSPVEQDGFDPSAATVVTTVPSPGLPPTGGGDRGTGPGAGGSPGSVGPATGTHDPDAARAGASEPWERWTAPDRSFTVELPGTPEVVGVPATGSLVDAHTEARASSSRHRVLVGWIDLRRPPTEEPELVLDAVRRGRFDRGALEVTSSRPTRVEGRPAVEFRARPRPGAPGTAGGPAGIAGVHVLSGDRIYELVVTAPEGTDPDIAPLRDSFRLTLAA